MAAGSAVAMIGANLRFGSGSAAANATLNSTRMFHCTPEAGLGAAVVVTLGALGMGANFILMAVILSKKQLRRTILMGGRERRPHSLVLRPAGLHFLRLPEPTTAAGRVPTEGRSVNICFYTHLNTNEIQTDTRT